MATKHVIAYAMHETELAAAGPIVENAQWTASYVIGDVDEDRIEELERAGLVVDEVAPAGRPTTAAMAGAPCRLRPVSTGGGPVTRTRSLRRSRGRRRNGW